MPFAATWMDLGIIILSKSKSERERQIPYDFTYMWNLKYDTNESIYATGLRIQRAYWWLPRRREFGKRDRVGGWGYTE